MRYVVTVISKHIRRFEVTASSKEEALEKTKMSMIGKQLDEEQVNEYVVEEAGEVPESD